ncbi:hypothetical protein Droror1_Dr00004682 [Drosera rotundifolia]
MLLLMIHISHLKPGSKRQKLSHCSTKTSQGKNHRERKGVVGKEGALSSRSSSNCQRQKPASVKQLKPSVGAKCLKPSHRPQQNFFECRSPRPQMVHQFQAGHYRPQFTLHRCDDLAYYAPARFSQGLPYSGQMMAPSAEYYGLDQRGSYFCPQMDSGSPPFFRPRIEPYFWRSYPSYNGL